MAVFHRLNVEEVSQARDEKYVVFTGKDHPLTKTQKIKCRDYLQYLNNKRVADGKEPIKNGEIYTIVHEQRTSSGKQLFLTERTDYAHFLTYRDQHQRVVKQIFGDVPIPPCPVGNPQTVILAKPASVETTEAWTAVLKQMGNVGKYKGVIILLGVMGEHTAFAGTVQAFGAGLTKQNMFNKKASIIKEHLEKLGFYLRSGDLVEGAGIWDLQKITNQALQSQAGITEADLAGDVIPIGTVRDNVGNYYWTSLTPVKKTEKEIIQGKPEDSKFEKLLSIPAIYHQAFQLTRMSINNRVYIELAIGDILKMIGKFPVPRNN